MKLKLENAEIMLAKITSDRFITRLKAKSKSLQLRKKSSRKNFHSFRVRKKIYSSPFTVTIETKIREFQYKVLNNIVFTNERLFSAEMFQRLSGKLSILGLVNVKLTFKHLK